MALYCFEEDKKFVDGSILLTNLFYLDLAALLLVLIMFPVVVVDVVAVKVYT